MPQSFQDLKMSKNWVARTSLVGGLPSEDRSGSGPPTPLGVLHNKSLGSLSADGAVFVAPAEKSPTLSLGGWWPELRIQLSLSLAAGPLQDGQRGGVGCTQPAGDR